MVGVAEVLGYSLDGALWGGILQEENGVLGFGVLGEAKW